MPRVFSQALAALAADMASPSVYRTLQTLIERVRGCRGIRFAMDEESLIRVSAANVDECRCSTGFPNTDIRTRSFKIGAFVLNYHYLLLPITDENPATKCAHCLKAAAAAAGLTRKDHAVTALQIFLAEQWRRYKKLAYTHAFVHSQDLREIYDDSDVAESCMNHSDGVDLYVNNPDKVQLMVIYDPDGDPCGRALFWTLDHSVTIGGQEFTHLLDRIYPTDQGHHVAYAMQTAREKGWIYKDPARGLVAQPASATDPQCAGDTVLQVTLESVSYWPYVDTLMYARPTLTDDGLYDFGRVILSNDGHGDCAVLDDTYAERTLFEDWPSKPMPRCAQCFIHIDTDTGWVLVTQHNFVDYNGHLVPEREVCQQCFNQARPVWAQSEIRGPWYEAVTRYQWALCTDRRFIHPDGPADIVNILGGQGSLEAYRSLSSSLRARLAPGTQAIPQSALTADTWGNLRLINIPAWLNEPVNETPEPETSTPLATRPARRRAPRTRA